MTHETKMQQIKTEIETLDARLSKVILQPESNKDWNNLLSSVEKKQETIDSLNSQIKSLFAIAGELVLYGEIPNSGHP